MNLTGQPPYQKGKKPRESRGVARMPNKEELAQWAIILTLGCSVGPVGCRGRVTIHHCGTGAGGRKDHKKVIPLCIEHHLGKEGIDGKCMSKRAWQVKYRTEEQLLKITHRKLHHDKKDTAFTT